MRQDADEHEERGFADTLLLDAGERHQERHRENRKMESKVKISAVGTVACDPSAASVRPGPR